MILTVQIRLPDGMTAAQAKKRLTGRNTGDHAWVTFADEGKLQGVLAAKPTVRKGD